jgi:hypothetical protein
VNGRELVLVITILLLLHTGVTVLPSSIENTTALSRVRRSNRRRCKSPSSHADNVEEVGNDDKDDDNEYGDDDDCVNNHGIDDNDHDDNHDENAASATKATKRKYANSGYTKEQDENWNEMFHRIVAYKNQHYSINVPYRYKADTKLGSWVKIQRQSYKYGTGRILECRVRRLDSIRFLWECSNDQVWDGMFQRLATYKKKHLQMFLEHMQ